MSAIPDSIADYLLRNGYERWLRLEEAKAEVLDDLKELFAEMKGQGLTPKALRESFRRVRDMDDADKQEHDAIVDLYVASLTRARSARTRESQSYAEAKGGGDTIGNSDPISHYAETGEITEQEQPETARDALRPSINDEPSPEAGPQAEASQSQDTGVGTLAGREGRHEGEAASADLPTHSHSPAPQAPQAMQADTGEVARPSAASPVAHYEDA